jgi:hypothetical protein
MIEDCGFFDFGLRNGDCGLWKVELGWFTRLMDLIQRYFVQ